MRAIISKLASLAASFSVLGLLAGPMAVVGTAEAGVIGVDFAPGSTGWTVYPNTDAWTLGYQFTVSSTSQITGLGFWDVGNGYGVTTVGIWDTSGNQLGSATSASGPVTTFADGAGLGEWNFFDFSYTLGSGSYVVGSWGDNMDYAFNYSGGDAVISTNGLSFDNWREQRGGIFQYPGDIVPYGANFRGFWGGNVRFGDGNAVPAPATLALFGLGLAGLGWSRRKKA